MARTIYDENVEFYLNFIDRELAKPRGLHPTICNRLVELMGDRILGGTVCDLCCGEGYLSRLLAARGTPEVTGIDASEELVGVARTRSQASNVRFRVDDAQVLSTVDDDTFDIVLSQMAVMDIADHRAMFKAVGRVLKTGGTFGFSLLHPCFHAPFRYPDEVPFLENERGEPSARVVQRYGTEGHWTSGGNGVRGTVGAYHRTLSTLVNDLLAAGFTLERLDEPLVPAAGLFAEVPAALIVVAIASGRA